MAALRCKLAIYEDSKSACTTFLSTCSVLLVRDDTGLIARLGDHEWQECRLLSWDTVVIDADMSGCLRARQPRTHVLVQNARVDTGIIRKKSYQSATRIFRRRFDARWTTAHRGRGLRFGRPRGYRRSFLTTSGSGAWSKTLDSFVSEIGTVLSSGVCADRMPPVWSSCIATICDDSASNRLCKRPGRESCSVEWSSLIAGRGLLHYWLCGPHH
jgi:hypothetical protein